MDSFVRNFILSSLFYLGALAILGMGMAMEAPWAFSLRYAHVHLGLLGWMSMMIFGVGYHVIPRFAGRPLSSRRLAEVHWVLANVSLIGMAVFFPLQIGNPAWRHPFLIASFFQMVSIFLFILNISICLFGKKVQAVPIGPRLARELMDLKRSA